MVVTAELSRTAPPHNPTAQAPAGDIERELRLLDLAEDWLFSACSAEGRAKLLREHGFDVRFATR